MCLQLFVYCSFSSQASSRLGPDTTEVNDNKSFLIAHQTRCTFCVFGARSINTKPSNIHAMGGLPRMRYEPCVGLLPPAESFPPPLNAPGCCCSTCCCCGSKTSRKSRERRRGDNVSHSPRLNSRMRCLQHNSRLTSKKFRNKLCTLDCCVAPRPRPFERAA